MASKDSPFIVVPFHQPLDEPMTVEEAKRRVGDWIQDMVAEGRLSFVAFADGERLRANGEEEEVMLFLMRKTAPAGWGRQQEYTVFENWTDEFEQAVLIDGHGQEDDQPLPPEQAMALWIAGFLAKNEAVPGSYRLRYRLIDGR
jgi:hypothetical protein